MHAAEGGGEGAGAGEAQVQGQIQHTLAGGQPARRFGHQPPPQMRSEGFAAGGGETVLEARQAQPDRLSYRPRPQAGVQLRADPLDRNP